MTTKRMYRGRGAGPVPGGSGADEGEVSLHHGLMCPDRPGPQSTQIARTRIQGEFDDASEKTHGFVLRNGVLHVDRCARRVSTTRQRDQRERRARGDFRRWHHDLRLYLEKGVSQPGSTWLISRPLPQRKGQVVGTYRFYLRSFFAPCAHVSRDLRRAIDGCWDTIVIQSHDRPSTRWPFWLTCHRRLCGTFAIKPRTCNRFSIRPTD